MSNPWTLLGWVVLVAFSAWLVVIVFISLWAVRERRRAWREFEQRHMRSERGL